jgi:general secretion pathway protein G
MAMGLRPTLMPRLAARASDTAQIRVPCAASGRFRKCSGFTLLELLVVIVIIGMLAGYVAPRYFAQIGKSEIQVARAQIDALEKALDQYRLDTRHYPSAEQGLDALNTKPANEPNWNGPYLKKNTPNDPWGRPYIYRTPGQKGDFDVLSYGRDGKPGGSGEDADIGNW